jgi:hypothetical protein
MQNNPTKKRGKNSKRGSTNNKRRLEVFAKAGTSSGADWGACSPDLMQGVVTLMTSMGGAVIFGLSREKGSYNLTLLLEGHKETLWFNGDAELDQELRDVLELLESMV